MASGADDAIIPSRRKADDMTRDASVIKSSCDLPMRGVPSVQHRNALLHRTVMLHMSATGGWDGGERGIVECIANTGCTATATVLQGHCTQRDLGPTSFRAEMDRVVLPWAKQMQRYGKW